MGGSHIAIPTILKVGKGTLENLGTYIKSSGMSNAVIYFGNDLKMQESMCLATEKWIQLK